MELSSKDHFLLSRAERFYNVVVIILNIADCFLGQLGPVKRQWYEIFIAPNAYIFLIVSTPPDHHTTQQN
jgi:hypothetical protein